jgi:hypothetical protein
MSPQEFSTLKRFAVKYAKDEDDQDELVLQAYEEGVRLGEKRSMPLLVNFMKMRGKENICKELLAVKSSVRHKALQHLARHLNSRGTGHSSCVPCITTLMKFKERIRMVTRRQQGKNVQEVVKALFAGLDQSLRMRVRSYMERKRAVKHQNRRTSNSLLAFMGLVSLLALRANYLFLPATGQPYRKAVYGKSVRTV